MPRDILVRISSEIRAAFADPELQQRVISMGALLASSPLEELAARLKREQPIWAEMVRVSGGQLE